MATIDCTIRYLRAEKTDMGYSYEPFSDPVRVRPVTLAALSDLPAIVRAVVAEIGHPCCTHVRLPLSVKRKPAGWDKATHAVGFVDCPAVVGEG